MRMRMSWGVIAAVGVVVAVVVATVVMRSRSDEPPALQGGPDVFRVHPAALPSGGQRKADSLAYEDATFQVRFGGAVDSDGTLSAGLTVTGPRGTLVPYAKYRKGQVVEVDGASLEVVRIFDAGDDADDVVDLRVIPG